VVEPPYGSSGAAPFGATRCAPSARKDQSCDRVSKAARPWTLLCSRAREGLDQDPVERIAERKRRRRWQESADRVCLVVVPEEVGPSGHPWRLRAAKRSVPRRTPDEASP
jgi:hypothetical protein